MIVRLLVALVLIPLRLIYAVLRFILLLPFPRRVNPYATLRLRGALPWREPGRKPWSSARRAGPSIEGIERSLELAGREGALRGVVVLVEDLKADRSRLDAVALALASVREAGKEVVLYWKQATARDFALMQVADRILLAPGGMVLLVGHAAAMTSLRSGLDKLGILPEFFRIGRWKTAPERFTRPDISPEQRGVVEEILDHRQGRLIDAVASRRGGDRSWAIGVIDDGPYTSRRAVEAGLVDALVYPDEIGSYLLAHPLERALGTGGSNTVAPRAMTSAPAGARGTSPEPPAQESAGSAQPREPARSSSQEGQVTRAKERDEEDTALQGIGKLRTSRRWRMSWPKLLPRQQVALVPIDGLIKSGHSASFPGIPNLAGDRTVSEALDRARKNPRIKGVIVKIDSRGGSASASELMWRSVRRCAQEKPTVAYVESVAASGGYFAAAGATRIIAAPGALVGSIGVFSGRFDARALLDRLGIHQEVVLRGANSGLLEPAHSLTDPERRSMEAEIAAIYEEFIERVAQGRGRESDEVRGFAEGRVFVAANAPATLVDELGDFRAALAWVCAEAGLDPRRVEVKMQARQGLLGNVGEAFQLPESLAISPLLFWPGSLDLE